MDIVSQIFSLISKIWTDLVLVWLLCSFNYNFCFKFYFTRCFKKHVSGKISCLMFVSVQWFPMNSKQWLPVRQKRYIRWLHFLYCTICSMLNYIAKMQIFCVCYSHNYNVYTVDKKKKQFAKFLKSLIIYLCILIESTHRMEMNGDDCCITPVNRY